MAAAVKMHKRRPVAPTKDTQIVNVNTLASLRAETTVEKYHTLFMNVELIMNAMLDYGVTDEVITIINTARLAQHERDVTELDKYRQEIVDSAKRLDEENQRVIDKAEADHYSPEATVLRATTVSNPVKLRPTEGGMTVMLTVTARLSHNLPTSSASLLKAEQIYGAFWAIKAKCFAVPRGVSVHAAYVAYMEKYPKLKTRGYRLLSEYRVVQSHYRNVDVYMLVNVSKLVALRDSKIIELGLSSRDELRDREYENQLPIIQRAELVAKKLPRTVSPESRRFIVSMLVRTMQLDEKKTRLQTARYARDGKPRNPSAAATLLSHN